MFTVKCLQVHASKMINKIKISKHHVNERFSFFGYHSKISKNAIIFYKKLSSMVIN